MVEDMGKSQYAEIVDTLVGDLAGCRPGARVASEHEIAARFTVSRAVAGPAGRAPLSAFRSTPAEPLPADLAARLEREPGSPAHRIVRQSWINAMPAGWVIEWIPDDMFPDRGDVGVRAVESLDQVLRQMGGVEPVRAWCRVSMELPPPEVATGLETDPGRHVWLVESVTRDAKSHIPVLANIWWARPDVIRV